MPRRIQTEAVVVRRDEFGESDRLVTLLSRNHGILRAIAPGARRSKRRFAGCLELFARIEILGVEKSTSGLVRLEEALLLDSHESIKSDLLSIGCASYAAELSAALLGEGDQAPEIYGLLVDFLQVLNHSPLDSKSIRSFELNLLSLAGFAPRLEACLVCGAQGADRWVYDHNRDGICCTRCASGPYLEHHTPSTIGFLRALQSGKQPEGRVNLQTRVSARELLERIILRHVGHPLKARQFLRQLVRRGEKTKEKVEGGY